LIDDINVGETESIAIVTATTLNTSAAFINSVVLPTDDDDNGAIFSFDLRQDGNSLVLDITREGTRYQFSTATFDTNEGDVTSTPNVVEITRVSSLPLIAEDVTVSATGGSATSGVDYTADPFVVSFAAGQASAFVPIEILGDLVPEADETIDLQITGFSGEGVVGDAGYCHADNYQ
jgi:hypothetical protein